MIDLSWISDILGWLLLAMGIALAIAVVGLTMIARRIRNLRVPEDAGYFATMHYIPVALVILLDLLDFGLDIFAAPISWIVLDRMGLKGLRNKAALEAFIPLTQPIPTFTISWILARVFNLGDLPPSVQNMIEAEYYERGQRQRLPEGQSRRR